MQHGSDIVVIGGGIAGVSIAAELSRDAAVTLVEAEAVLAHHSTGRSAALFFGSYGHPDIRPLSAASLRWFLEPPTEHPVLTPRGVLTLIPRNRPDPELVEGSIIPIDEAVDRVPVVRKDRFRSASWEPDPADMDVAAIHQTQVRRMRARGASIHTGARVTSIARNDNWTVETTGGLFHCDHVVDAAGAWGDEIAILAGARPIGLTPKRRTAFMVNAPEGSAEWPLVTSLGHPFYFKPDGIQLLCSPADETPSPAVDARPEELDIALAIERINEATTLGIRSVRSSWAGLRTFAPDGSMVIGPDPEVDGFHWLVGQGGTGIQTAPAAGRLGAALVLGAPVPDDLAALGVDADTFSPSRLR